MQKVVKKIARVKRQGGIFSSEEEPGALVFTYIPKEKLTPSFHYLFYRDAIVNLAGLFAKFQVSFREQSIILFLSIEPAWLPIICYLISLL